MSLFNKQDLQSRAQRLSKSLVEANLTKLANSMGTFDIFLSHSYRDAMEIEALREHIEEMGFSVYVDWVVDSNLDRKKVDAKTANLLRTRMQNCKSLLYVASANARDSAWMPWELGYFDGFKNRVAILPIADQPGSGDSYSGQEYLGLYPYITVDTAKGASTETLWVHDSSSSYVIFKNWLAGKNPSPRS